MADQPPSNTPGRPRWVKYLSEEDAALLESLMAATNQDEQSGLAQAHDPRRSERMRRLLMLLDQLPAGEDDPQRVQRTLNAVRAAQQRERFVMNMQMRPAPHAGGGAFNWRQIAAIAAMLILGTSLLIPVLHRNRAEARRLACAANLRAAGEAFGQYAADFRNAMPRGHVKPGVTWWNVGKADSADDEVVHSNSAHLYLLVRGRYIRAAELSCPSNPHAPKENEMSPKARDWQSPQQVSYSYQNQYTDHVWQWNTSKSAQMAVLADKNPLFVARNGRVHFDPDTPAAAPSRGHGRRGQNVLTVNGSVDWTERPVIRHGNTPRDDNIWVAHGIDRYTGTEQPRGAEDTFLVP